MGTGPSCDHTNTKIVGDVFTHSPKLSIWKREIATMACDDCDFSGRVEVCRWKFTGIQWSRKLVDKRTCQHEPPFRNIDIDNVVLSRVSKGPDFTLAVMTLGYLLEDRYTPIQIAPFDCRRCGFRGYVRASYALFWEKKEEVQRLASKWEIMTKDKPMQTQQQQYIQVPMEREKDATKWMSVAEK